MKTVMLAPRVAAAALTALLTLVGASGCATYADQPALDFRDFDYSSVEGAAWPAHDIELPEIAERHGMQTVPRVHYVELNPQGQQTLVFIHGLGSYLKFWRYNLDHFAQLGYRVIALDQVGYGKSSKQASFPYTMEAMADVVRALVARLKVSDPILIGHSMGGQTAMSYAIRYPDALEALVLASPAGFESFSEREEQWFREAIRSALIRASDEAAVWGSVRHANFNQWDDAYAWLIEERVRASKNAEFPAYAYANVRSIQGLADNDFVRGSLEHIKVPTIIIHGDRDRLIPSPFMGGGLTADIMAYGEEQIPQATRVELAGCGHTIQMDCHESFNATAADFISKLGGAKPAAPAPAPAKPAEPEAPAEPAEPEAPAEPAEPEAPAEPADGAPSE